MNEIIEVKNLKVSFKTKKTVMNIIRGVDIELYEGQILGIVGESGSGKSVTSKSLLNVNKDALTTLDSINILGEKYEAFKDVKWKNIRGKKISYVPQNPHTSLNPSRKIYKQILDVLEESNEAVINLKNIVFEEVKAVKEDFAEKLAVLKDKKLTELNKEPNKKSEINLKYAELSKVLKIERAKKIKEIKFKDSKEAKINMIKDIFKTFHIKDMDRILNAYPHELSGGLKQRVIIAMSVLTGAKIIIADEPTTALDATVQSSVLNLMQNIVKKLNISMIFISHNIGVIAKLCDYIYVMYAGRVVEKASKVDLFTDPVHPYTWALISSIPEGADKNHNELYTIPGNPVDMANLPQGDPFASRNEYAIALDFKQEPPLFEYKPGHWAATWMLHPSYPKTQKPKEMLRRINDFAKTLKK